MKIPVLESTFIKELWGNFIKKNTPTQVFLFCECCRIFKITCFEELRLVASIKRYFDTINLKQCGFCRTYFFKILVSELKYKNNHKICESQKIYIYNSPIYNVYVMFYYKILWFYQDFKSGNLRFLNLYSVDAARILELLLEVILSPPKWEAKHLYNS